MNRGRFILYLFIPVLAGLLSLLGWNSLEIFRFERKNLQEKVESSIQRTDEIVLWHNGGLLNSNALMLTDKDYEQKVAFAAGFTHNKGKIAVLLDEEDTAMTKAPGFDTMPVINKKYLTENHIKYAPAAVMTIKQFDSLFKIELKKNRAAIPYQVVKSKRADSAVKDSFTSAPFIIDFFTPRMYCVHYILPAGIVIAHILPYLFSTLLLCALLVLGFMFYYRSYRMQVEMSALKESLFGNITHELKTPLTSMQLIVDAAKKNISDSAMVSVPARHIQFAENELSRMKLIVDRILSFSKMTREQFVFNTEWVDLDNAISEAMKIMEINAQQANGTITYEGGARLAVLGDPILLVNAISAILDNALKYVEGTPVIRISLTTDGQHGIIAVQDNGIGIPEHYYKKIFQPFFRIPTGNVYNTSGHGLGLSFVMQVVKLHHGSISIVSNETGATFYLKFKTS